MLIMTITSRIRSMLARGENNGNNETVGYNDDTDVKALRTAPPRMHMTVLTRLLINNEKKIRVRTLNSRHDDDRSNKT